jgi:hypothetical protein
MGMQALSGAMGAYGAIAQGQAQAGYYDMQASAAEHQAWLNDIAAERANLAAHNQMSADYALISERGKRTFGAQRAAAAASGADVSNSASIFDVISDSARAESADKGMLEYNAAAARSERDLQTKLNKISLQNQAAQARIAGRNAKTSAYMNAFNGILQTGATVASTWYANKPKAAAAGAGGGLFTGNDKLDLYNRNALFGGIQ